MRSSRSRAPGRHATRASTFVRTVERRTNITRSSTRRLMDHGTTPTRRRLLDGAWPSRPGKSKPTSSPQSSSSRSRSR
eukprot:14736220-Heterocapsa_arctica.AAC.1